MPDVLLLIDCYNLLHVPMPAMLAGLDTAGLCQVLARTPWRDEGIRVVCDGQPGPLGLAESPEASVELIYSGVTRTADDVIIEFIEQATAPRRLIIVSSDREIRKAARRRRATSWTSETFITRLIEALRTNAPTPTDKPAPSELPPEQVRDWLRTFGFDASEADEPPHRRNESTEDDESDYWPPW